MSSITIANGHVSTGALASSAFSNTVGNAAAVESRLASRAVRAATPARAAQPVRLRMTARGRRALAFLVATPVIVVGGWLAWSGATATATQVPITTEHAMVTVYPGDTLWSIAEAVAPGADPREVIADITQLNDLAGSIVPGQQLAIPLEYTE